MRAAELSRPVSRPASRTDLPRHAYRRGTRGFAAFVVGLVGLVRRRTWSPALTSYLAAIGIGVAAYGLLVSLTGLDPFGATSSLPGDQARAEGFGLLLWMIGLWTVGARFAIRGFRRS
jgi:hypothetical protein